ncbi:hypothetical protein ACIPUD_11085 [Bradyrhizobium sp. CAR08]
MGDLVESGGGGLPEVRTFERLDRAWGELDAVRTAVATAYEPTAGLLVQIDQALATSRQHASEIADAAEPVPRGVLALHLTLLMSAYPNSGQQNAKAYGRLLREDVLSLEPVAGAIDLACRRWRRKSRFLPAIAEMMDEVRSAQSQIEGAVEFVRRLPALRAEMASKISSP